MIVKGKIIGYFHIFFLHIRNVIDLGSKTLKTKKIRVNLRGCEADGGKKIFSGFL